MLFIHTADLQIGRPFASVSDHTKRTCLQLARINVIDQIAEQVKETGAKFVLIAGDFFDTPTVSQNTISSALGKIGQIPVPVYLIPGNHDFGGPGSLWEQDFLSRERTNLAPNLEILLTREPVETDHAVIYPCPLLSKQEAEAPTRWLFEREIKTSSPDKPNILLAHGTVQGFGGDDASLANHLRLDQIDTDAFDYIALGDWHGTKQINDKAWYSGTPEIDRFGKGDDYHPGQILTVDANTGKKPKVNATRTSDLSWHDLNFTFSTDQDVDVLEEKLNKLIELRTNKDLLKLTLDGSLGLEASRKFENLLETYEARLLRIKPYISVSIAPSEAEIASLADRPGDPVLSKVATNLLERLKTGDEEEREIITIALRELYSRVAPLTEQPASSDEEPMEFGELFEFGSAA